MSYVLLTETDERILKQIVQQVQQAPVNLAGDPGLAEAIPGAPEVYVAHGEMTALSGVGTAGATPGSGTCTLYLLSGGTLVSLGQTRTVYNLSTTALTEGWYLVSRTKQGYWFATGVGGGATKWGICRQSYNAFEEVTVEIWEGVPGGDGLDTGETVDAVAPGVGFSYSGLGLIGDLVPISSYKAFNSSAPEYGFRPLSCEGTHSNTTGTGT